jgi:lysine 6-dehydrogenase
VKGSEVVPRELFHALFEPQVRTEDDVRDVGIVRVHSKGNSNGQPMEAVVEAIDYYDERTGFTAMQRMTGWHASIVAAMMARQEIPLGAVPLELAVPGRAFVVEARRRGFKITERSGPVEVADEAFAQMI